MYENLSNELSHFDYQKELELRDIFIEYTTLKFEHYEKVMLNNSSNTIYANNLYLAMKICNPSFKRRNLEPYYLPMYKMTVFNPIKFHRQVKSKWEAATVMTEMKLSRENRAIAFSWQQNWNVLTQMKKAFTIKGRFKSRLTYNPALMQIWNYFCNSFLLNKF